MRMQEDFQQQLAQQQLAHDQLLRTAAFQHAAGETERLRDTLGASQDDMATIFAGASGARSVAETADALNEDRERRREQDRDGELRRQTWAREDARYEREIDRENTQLQYQMEITRLKAQAEVVATGINRGLADHRDIEHITSVLNGVVKSLESASVGPSRPEAAPGGEAQPEPAADDSADAPIRAEADDDHDVVEAEVIPDDPGNRDDDAGAGLREEDLGR
jgi:hypothetical protein